jgi:hypothetical protein
MYSWPHGIESDLCFFFWHHHLWLEKLWARVKGLICGGVGPKSYQKMHTDVLYLGILGAVQSGQSYNFKEWKTKEEANTGLGRWGAQRQAKYWAFHVSLSVRQRPCGALTWEALLRSLSQCANPLLCNCLRGVPNVGPQKNQNLFFLGGGGGDHLTAVWSGLKPSQSHQNCQNMNQDPRKRWNPDVSSWLADFFSIGRRWTNLRRKEGFRWPSS